MPSPRLLAPVAVLTVLALSPAAAHAGAPPAGHPTLSARLAALASPGVAAAPASRQAQATSTAASGPGSLQRDGSRVVVQVRFAGAPDAGTVSSAGGQVLGVDDALRTVTASVAPGDLARLGNGPGVEHVGDVLTPLTRGDGARTATPRATCAPAATSQGDARLKAAAARSTYGVDGSGTTVGVLSDSYDKAASASTRAATDVKSGDLPGTGNPCGRTTPVRVLSEGSGEDEGRAMLQIVHDLAPGAKLDFAAAGPDDLTFARNIVALRDAGATSIVDDVSYFNEPFFQDGPLSNAVTNVVSRGATFSVATGNDNVSDSAGRPIASWESPAFRPVACPAMLNATDYPKCEDFNPGTGVDNQFQITIPAGANLTIDLQWSEPWYGVKTDLDAFLYSGTTLLAQSGDTNAGAKGTQQPVEVLSYDNTGSAAQTVSLVIPRYSGAAAGTPRLKFITINGAQTAFNYPSSSGGDIVGPSVFGHEAAKDAISAAAADPTDTLEPYSSHGPATLYWNPVSGTTPATATAAQPIAKPDITGTDCVRTTFFFGSSKTFCGTSAAAPHIAAVAALQQQALPGATRDEILFGQQASATKLAGATPLSEGAGLASAVGAIASLPAPRVTIVNAPAASTNTRPSVTFAVSHAAATTCALDGGAAVACGSPFTPASALSVGTHSLVVTATDRLRHTGSATATLVVNAPPVTKPATPVLTTKPTTATTTTAKPYLATLLGRIPTLRLSKRSLRFTVECSTTCDVRASLRINSKKRRRLHLSQTLVRRSTTISGTFVKRTLTLRIGRRTASRLRRGHITSLQLVVAGTTPLGLTTTVRRGVKVRRS